MIIHPVLNGPLKKDGTQPIKIRITHSRRTVYVHVGVSVKPSHFDKKSGLVKTICPEYSVLNKKILDMRLKLNKAQPLIEQHAGALDLTKIKKIMLSFDDEKHIAFVGENDFFELATKIAVDLEIDGKKNHANLLLNTRNILMEFRQKQSLPVESITYLFLRDFRRWYVGDHGKLVTFNKHLRYIRLVFKEGHRRKLISRDIYPFEEYAIPTGYKAEIRCLPPETIRRIYFESKGIGRDMFMLSFFFCGMNAIDMMTLSHSPNGYIDTERTKTIRSLQSVRLRLKIQPEAQEIIDRYADPEKKVLIGLPYKASRNFSWAMRRYLKKICDELKLPEFSMIYARHSFATIAGSLKIPDHVIDKGLMHSSQDMIERYREFDFSILDDAVRQVIDWTLYGIRKDDRKQ